MTPAPSGRRSNHVSVQRTIVVDKPIEVVFGYLSDFTTTTEWDPGTVRTEWQSGNGDVGTEYRNTSRFLGRTVELVYIVEEFVDNNGCVSAPYTTR